MYCPLLLLCRNLGNDKPAPFFPTKLHEPDEWAGPFIMVRTCTNATCITSAFLSFLNEPLDEWAGPFIMVRTCMIATCITSALLSFLNHWMSGQGHSSWYVLECHLHYFCITFFLEWTIGWVGRAIPHGTCMNATCITSALLSFLNGPLDEWAGPLMLWECAGEESGVSLVNLVDRHILVVWRKQKNYAGSENRSPHLTCKGSHFGTRYRKTPSSQISRVGQSHIYGVYPVLLAEESPNIRPYTVYIYGLANPTNKRKRPLHSFTWFAFTCVCLFRSKGKVTWPWAPAFFLSKIFQTCSLPFLFLLLIRFSFTHSYFFYSFVFLLLLRFSFTYYVGMH